MRSRFKKSSDVNLLDFTRAQDNLDMKHKRKKEESEDQQTETWSTRAQTSVNDAIYTLDRGHSNIIPKSSDWALSTP